MLRLRTFALVHTLLLEPWLIADSWVIALWIPAVSHWTGTSMLSVAQATHVRASLCTPLQRGLAATEVFVCDAWLMLRWLYAGLYDGLQKFFFVSSFRIIYHGQHPFYIWSPRVPSPETTRQPDLLLSGIVRLLWLGFEFFWSTCWLLGS